MTDGAFDWNANNSHWTELGHHGIKNGSRWLAVQVVRVVQAAEAKLWYDSYRMIVS